MSSTTAAQAVVISESAAPRPVQRFAVGDIQVAVWANHGYSGGVVHRATVNRRYRQRDGTWRSSGSFAKSDLPNLIAALEQACEQMLE